MCIQSAANATTIRPITCPEPGEHSKRHAVPSLSDVLRALAAAKGAQAPAGYSVDNPFDAHEQNGSSCGASNVAEVATPTIVRFTLGGLDAVCGGIAFATPQAASCA